MPICSLDEKAGEVAKRMRAAGWEMAVALNGARVILGLVARAEAEAEPGKSVEEVMQNGPRTYRPDTALDKMMEHMRRQNSDNALIASPGGILLGVLGRAEAEAQLRK